jgi:hypothetical protein
MSAPANLQGANGRAAGSSNSPSVKRCCPPVASNIRSRQRRSIPWLVICTPSTGCSSSSSSEYSFDLLNILPSDPRHRKLEGAGSWPATHLQFLLSIRVVAGALLRSGPATSKRSAATSSRLVPIRREIDGILRSPEPPLSIPAFASISGTSGRSQRRWPRPRLYR